MLRCFGDESAPVPLLLTLRHAGVDVSWVGERGLKGMADPLVAELALREQRVVLTTDDDFLSLSAEASLVQAPFPPVIYWKQGTRSLGESRRRILKLIDRDDYDTLIGIWYFA